MRDYNSAVAEAEKLARLNDDALFEELGLRIEDANLPGGDTRSQGYSGQFRGPVSDLGKGSEVFKKIGSKFWKNIEPQIMGLICDPKNEDLQKLTNNRSIPQLAAGLATAGVLSVVVAPPAWVIVIATILATRIAEAGLAAVCETWAEERG